MSSTPAPFYHRWIIGLLVKRRGLEAVNAWFWNCTPYPFAPPYIRDYFEAVSWTILPERIHAFIHPWLFETCMCCGRVPWLNGRAARHDNLCRRCDERVLDEE